MSDKETPNVVATRYAEYRRAVKATLVAYRRRHFAGRGLLFERGPRGEPLFRREVAHLNFFDPALYHALTRRPRAFRRLGNPQVLAISVFGTLARREGLDLLSRVACDEGEPILPEETAQALTLDLQRSVPLPGRRPVRVDVDFDGAEPGGWRLAVHGRLAEPGLGSLARLLEAARAARGRPRSILMVYDARNPALAPGRPADEGFLALQAGLRRTRLSLRRTTWQALAAAMAGEDWYSDLVAYLQAKYGIGAEPAS